MSVFRWAAVSRVRLVFIAVAVVIAVTSVVIATAVASAPEIPRNTLAPEVTGGGAVGELLSCGAGSWENISSTPAHSSPFSYQWDRNGTAIANPNTTNPDIYRVTAEDRGGLISCVVTAYNYDSETKVEVSEYEESSNSVRIEGEQTSAPVNTALPVISGTPAVGQILECSNGTWSGSPTPTYTYQWLSNGVAIGGSNASGYQVKSEDEGHSLSCTVTASNSSGSASATSSPPVQVHTSKPENTEAPKVLGGTSGTAVLGESLTCTQGTWSGAPAPTYTYQWLRDGESIASATATTYTVVSADEGHLLSCRVTASNAKGVASETSSNQISVGGSAPTNTAAPVVSGTATLGNDLQCSSGTWTGKPTYMYQWVRDQVPISISGTSAHKVTEGDHGHALYCVVYATNTGGESHQSSQPVPVEPSGSNLPVNRNAPVVSGEPRVGRTLTCSAGEWEHEPALYSYKWLRDGVVVATATGEGTRTVLAGDAGHSLSCEVTAYNSGGKNSRTSGNSLAIAGAAPKNLKSPLVLGPNVPAVNETLTCSPGEWSGSPTPEYAYQWYRDGVEIGAAAGKTYVVAEADRGRSLSCQVAAKNTQGTVSMFSINALKVRGLRPVNLEAPGIAGKPELNQELTCSRGRWEAQPEAIYTYQWLLDGQPDGAASAATSHKVGISERGRSIACEVIAKNSEGETTATSGGLHVPGIPPKDEEPPKVSGSPTIGAPLTCARGLWNGRPGPVFTYQWQRDGVNITAATGSTYTVEGADQGHLLSCNVTATNSEGTAEAESGNSLAVPAAQARNEVKAVESVFIAPLNQAPPLTAGQILSTLGAQLAHALRGAHIAGVLKTKSYVFSFQAPAAGTLNVFWFEVPKGAHVAAKKRPILVMWGTTFYPSAGKRLIRLHLTTPGRLFLRHNKHVKLTAKAVFVRAGHSPVTWLKTFQLNH